MVETRRPRRATTRWAAARPRGRRRQPAGRAAASWSRVRGRSGSGKTTLLSLIGALDRPTSGSVASPACRSRRWPSRELVAFRRRTIGFIFQAFGLLPILSAAENVEIPLRLVGAEPASARAGGSRELLELVGLGGPAATTGRTSCRAASSSASRSRARSPTGRASSSPTSRPASSTRRPGATSWRCSGSIVRDRGHDRASWPPTTRRSSTSPTG